MIPITTCAFLFISHSIIYYPIGFILYSLYRAVAAICFVYNRLQIEAGRHLSCFSGN